MKTYLFKNMCLLGLCLVIFSVCDSRAQAQGVDTGNINRTTSHDYLGGNNNELYSIAFKRCSLREALQFLAWIADFNIVIPEGTEGVVNLSFRDVTVGDAINAIIKSNELEYTVEGKIIRLGKGDQFKDTGEDLKTEHFRLKYASAKELETKVKPLLSNRGSAIFDDRTNALTVRELPANLDNVRKFVENVDVKDAQVLIESKIMEATRSFSRDLGIQWGVTKGSDTSKAKVAGITAVGQADSGRNLNVNLSPTTPTSGILIGSFMKGLNLDVQILAAEARGDAYIISDPSIVTSNGKQAKIRSGATLLVQGSSSVTIGTSSGSSSTGSNLQEIETGIELIVTPQITINDYIKMEIETLSSTPDFARAVQGVPIIVDNTAKTTVLVRDGETTVIGGLSRFSDSLSRKKVPYFADIPLLGNLFKSKARAKSNSELLVFIKPSIIRVEGTLPAQVRVREIEERRDAMYLVPDIDPRKDKAAAEKREAMIQKRKGNKYVR